MPWVAMVEVGPGSVDLEFQRRLATELPHLRFCAHTERGVRVQIRPDEWLDPNTQLLALDHRVHEAEDEARASGSALVMRIEPSVAHRRALAARQATTRYQRLFPRKNRGSLSARFEAVLQRHRALHDLSKPLVRADYEHSLDVWQWVLRLAPLASLPLQVAALFHDVERLESEADVRVEQHARDYLEFKQRHAARGSHMLLGALGGLGLDRALVERVADLVEHHEQPGQDRELAILNDADALSFFSLNAAGFLNYYGPAHTATKVAYTLGRMRAQASRRLQDLRLPPSVRELALGQLGSGDRSQPAHA